MCYHKKMHLDDPKTRARFEAKVDRAGECHVWKAAHIPSGHGVFWLAAPDAKLVYAHRVALEHKLGRPLQEGEMATHRCDTPPCVNPDHLEPGDALKNSHDAVSRSRHMHGAGHYLTHLTDQDAREIVALLATPGVRQDAIARRYGVSRASITQIKKGRSWKNIPRPASWPSTEGNRSELTIEQVRAIIALLNTPGTKVADIARMYGVSATIIYNIQSGRTWKSVSRS